MRSASKAVSKLTDNGPEVYTRNEPYYELRASSQSHFSFLGISVCFTFPEGMWLFFSPAYHRTKHRMSWRSLNLCLGLWARNQAKLYQIKQFPQSIPTFRPSRHSVICHLNWFELMQLDVNLHFTGKTCRIYRHWFKVVLSFKVVALFPVR
jgi:hypothetical protein